MEDIFKKIRKEVNRELHCSAHKSDHTDRVYSLALRLAEGENIDLDILKAAVLLHDIAGIGEMNDSTGNTDHAVEGAKMAGSILQKMGFPEEKIKHIQSCITSHRYKTDNQPKTLEAKILFDADKIDAVGAIGIARAFMWVGKNNAHMYYKPENMKKYIKDNLGGKENGRIKDKTIHSPQIELETKVKPLENKLYTKKAKKICRERAKYFKDFLCRLEKEIKGEI